MENKTAAEISAISSLLDTLRILYLGCKATEDEKISELAGKAITSLLKEINKEA